MKKPIFLAGPTASGKSAVAILLCKALDGEVVSADSMQIYKGMDIGTAKPTKEEMAGIPHHMIDVAEVSETWSVEKYVERASAVIEDILRRGKTPVVAGGTGQYFDGLLWKRRFAPIQEDNEIRKNLQEFAKEHGNEALWRQLQEKDPEAAATLHPNNVRRVIRALEICMLTGRPVSEHYANTQNPEKRFDGPLFGLCPADRTVLYKRIDKRVDIMMENGLLEEAKALYAAGLAPCSTAGQAIGYKELWPVIRGEKTMEEAAEDLKQATRRYAKRQLTWFRRMAITWFYYEEDAGAEDLADMCLQALQGLGSTERKPSLS
jgi:tRNA dimethylallyltransferase